MKRCKLPNFLIVGAAKSGTTSLYHYLKQHPDIYLSKIKEPKFITAQFLQFPFRGTGDDMVEMNILKTYDDYCSLFDVNNGEKATGEASADNLYYYDKAIGYIRKYLGYPKIIMVLRNPADRAFSAYAHLFRDGRESLPFEIALTKEDERKRNNWEFIWFYKDVGFYHKQVKAYLEKFNQVKIYLYDDMKRDALGVVKDVFAFLGVDSSIVPDLSSRYNVSLIPKNKLFHKFLTEPNVIKDAVRPLLKIFFPPEKIGKTVEGIIDKNLSKPEMKPETREYLINMYREDILKLQVLIQRDLSDWLR